MPGGRECSVALLTDDIVGIVPDCKFDGLEGDNGGEGKEPDGGRLLGTLPEDP